MLLIQTAFDQEHAAVMAAASRVLDRNPTSVLIANRECQLLMTGIGPTAARQQLTRHLEQTAPPTLVLSIGLAGGLLPDLYFGQTCLIEHVHMPAQPAALTASLERLSSNLTERLRVHNLVTLPQPALTAQAKQQLAKQQLPSQQLPSQQFPSQVTAGLCDMETYSVADVCRQHGLPWLGVRVVSDEVSESIPKWVLTLPRLIEQKRWLTLLGRLATHPQDFPSLLRLGKRMQRLKPILTQLTIDLVTHVRP